MHSNPAFHDHSDAENLAFAAQRGFGTLMVNGADGPLASHVPFLIEGAQITLHLTRSNPICRAGIDQPALLAVTGPDGYISPDWYGADDQVPTWNYVAVHIRGVLSPLPPESLHEHLVTLSARFESDLAPKKPWTIDKMSDGVMDRMMRMILPYRMTIASVDGTWKLNQNKPESQRMGAADALEQHGAAALATLMRAINS
jgi:transcriptional regulator